MTLNARFQVSAAAGGDRLALTGPGHEGLTWAQYADLVAALAAGFAGLGVVRGERVALLMGPRPEFSVVDVALMHAGATPYSIQVGEPVERIASYLAVAQTRWLVTEARLLPLARQVAERTGATLVSVDRSSDDAVLDLADVSGASTGHDVETLWRAVGPEDIATLIFTSGTTGTPKAVQLSHRAIATAVDGTLALAPSSGGGEVLSYLPLNHIAERFMSHYTSIVAGLTVHSVPDPGTLYETIRRVRPARFFGVPRVYEKVVDRIEVHLNREPRLRSAQQVLLDAVRDEQEGRAEAHPSRVEAAHAELGEVREAIGLDRAEYLGVATAPSARPMLEKLLSVGLRVSDIWGMSEIIMCTLNPPDAIRLGTVGRFLPGMEGRIAEDGEILVRGPHAFSGYVDDPDRTSELLGTDGWVHTGDLGRIDDGYLTIAGRKKEVLITATGKNLMPAVIEGAVKTASPLIDHALAVAEGRRFVTAVVALDPDELGVFATRRGMLGDFAALAASQEVQAEVHAAVEAANAHLSRPESVRGFVVAPEPWSTGGDLVTPTSKLRRDAIVVTYADAIDALYA